MCLELSPDWRKETKAIREQEGPIIGYKIVHEDLESELEDYQWSLGINKSNRWLPFVGPIEFLLGSVFRGFHFYANRKDARDHHFSRRAMLKCEINPKDVIAIGHWGDTSCPNIVATKTKVVEILRKEDL